MWIHQRRDWPDFTWDAERLTLQLTDVRHRQGRLLGRMESLGFALKREAGLNTLTLDVVKSSAIEGDYLDPAQVRSSIARRLGIEIAGLVPASRYIDGVVEMMLDATRGYLRPLTKTRLFNWHAALFPTGRSGISQTAVGAWRTIDSGPTQVVSGPLGRQTVHFEAPDARRLENEMTRYLAWFEGERKLDPVLAAGIAHLWFVAVHPFEDGNGRIARTIADMLLARADGMADRYYSLSTQIESERNSYYGQLEKQQRETLDITDWLEWFLDCLGRAVTAAEKSLSSVLYKARLWERINENPVNERQRLVINRMLEDDFPGYMNTSKYAAMSKCSNDTALRDIQSLKTRGIFIQNPGGGRSTSYRLPSLLRTD